MTSAIAANFQFTLSSETEMSGSVSAMAEVVQVEEEETEEARDARTLMEKGIDGLPEWSALFYIFNPAGN